MKFSFITICYCFFSFSIIAQPFNDRRYLDINDIKASVSLHGDMFARFDTATFYDIEYPRGSKINPTSLTSIWASAFDQNSQLYTSAQTYRQKGSDFWPGPLDNTGALTLNTSRDWARIWKVSFNEINNHIASTNRTVNNVPKDILEWPAKGNAHARGANGASLSITYDMAPFVDVDNDGVYNALKGDYPKIKGDQMLWRVFSDNGPSHGETNGMALRFEYHASSYAFKRNSALDNILFFEYEIINKSAIDYEDCRIGLFCDADLGFWRDDYVGVDSASRVGYIYNITNPDGNSSQPLSYGTSIPATGYVVLEQPNDNNNLTTPLGSFVSYINDNTIRGNPLTPLEYSNYMRALLRNNTQIVNDYTKAGVHTDGIGTGAVTNYMFSGNPSDTTEWSECSSSNPVGDRRFIMSSQDFNFQKNARKKLAFALVVTDTSSSNHCGGFSLTEIKKLTDTAVKAYSNPPKTYVSVNSINVVQDWSVSPNPSNDVLNVNRLNNEDATILIRNSVGQVVFTQSITNEESHTIDVSTLASGVYYISLKINEHQRTKMFIKM